MEPIPTINTTGIKIYIINLIKNKKSNFIIPSPIINISYYILFFNLFIKEKQKMLQSNTQHIKPITMMK